MWDHIFTCPIHALKEFHYTCFLGLWKIYFAFKKLHPKKPDKFSLQNYFFKPD